MIPVKDDITIISVGVLDDWGRPSEPTTQTVKGRVDYRNEIVKDNNGQDTLSKATILLKGVVIMSVEDTVQWSDVYGIHEEKPISVSPIKDLSNKVIFTKVVI
jgi:hypothetical protein